jgi:Response regulators consisting of a CheY-like receiver domain and a winged-helix DNA-binding domain
MTDRRYKILVIDDEPQIRRLLKVSLTAHGYDFEEAAAGRDGINKTAVYKPDLLLVDLGLPDLDGKSVVTELRGWTQVPIIVLTVRDQEQEKIAALDAGADDYVTKPFSVGELLARIRVSLRRSQAPESEPKICCGDLSVDLNLRRVTVRGQEVKLTPTEYDILKVLVQHAGRVLTHKQLLKAVWGNEYGDDTQYVRVYIGQLRRKIEDDPARPRYIITESGVGYRLMDRP